MVLPILGAWSSSRGDLLSSSSTRGFGRARHLLPLGLAFTVLACSNGSATEVLIVVDTDMMVPSELDEVRIDVLGPDGSLKRAQGSITSDDDLPRTVGIAWRGGSLAPVQATVTGLQNGGNRIQRRATFAFVQGEVRVLRMDLLRGCVQHDPPCTAAQTCGAEGCRSVIVDPSELLPYMPPGRFDGGPDGGGDGSACVPTNEVCDGIDNNCDGVVDEGFNLQTDPMHCGSCTNACDTNPLHATATCVGGHCGVMCDNGYDNCDSNPLDCEAVLTMPASCGRCGVVCMAPTPSCDDPGTGYTCVGSCTTGATNCSGACVDTTSDPTHCMTCDHVCPDVANASATCTSSACTYRCDMGFYDCNAMPSDGCESMQLELDNCGACNVACARDHASVTCATGTCQIVSCTAPYDNCDGNLLNGCETDLTSTPGYCGSCTNACPTSVSHASSVGCASGRCVAACTGHWGDCDGRIGTGCETRIDTTSDCGGCGLGCNSGETCVASPSGGYACSNSCPDPMNCMM